MVVGEHLRRFLRGVTDVRPIMIAVQFDPLNSGAREATD